MLDPLDQHPSDRYRGRRDLRHEHGHASSAIGGQLAARIEPEPAHPKHRRADNCQRQIMRFDRLSKRPTTLPDHQTAHQASNCRIDVDNRSACEIDHIPFVK
jgi:hypothetical protein